jgi:hypothetical protein
MDERRILDGLTGAVLALVFVVAPPLLAESIGHDEQGANLPGGRVFHSGGIVNRASGKALDVRDQSTHDGAAIQQWDFSRQSNQMWSIIEQGSGVYAIISLATGKSLDVTNHQATDGARIQQFAFAKVDNQLWKIQPTSDGYYQIVSLSSGKCLDVELGNINDNGANVQQWNCASQPNQQWRLVK